MRGVFTITLLLIATLFFAARRAEAQGEDRTLTTEQQQAREELTQAAQAYKRGRFSEAELHSRRALELDPEDKDAPLFIARSIHAQYKQGVDTPENQRIAERAIEAYKSIISKDANNEAAFKAVAYLLVQLGRTDEQQDWIAGRAENPSVEPLKRSEAYTFLASKEWECSFQITERKENQRTVVRSGRTVIAWRMPRDPNVFDRAKQCAMRGLEFVEQAILLSPEFSKAWGYKTNLLLEMVKLSEMEGNTQAREDYKRQADDAQKRTTELVEKENEGTKEQKPIMWPPPAP